MRAAGRAIYPSVPSPLLCSSVMQAKAAPVFHSSPQLLLPYSQQPEGQEDLMRGNLGAAKQKGEEASGPLPSISSSGSSRPTGLKEETPRRR